MCGRTLLSRLNNDIYEALLLHKIAYSESSILTL